MNRTDLDTSLNRLFDQFLLFHGFTRTMRDYEFIVYQTVDPSTGLSPRYLRFLFRYCTEADVRSSVQPEGWARSLSDEFLKTEHVSRGMPGYAWGVSSQVMYPGATIIEESDRARAWRERVGIPFYEVRVEANAHNITLVFSDLAVDEVAQDYVPFAVGNDGVAERYAQGSTLPLSPDSE